jgi:hypothetical protein
MYGVSASTTCQRSAGERGWVGVFSDGKSALMLAAARLRYIAGTQWGTKRYLRMDLLRDLDAPEAHVP